MAGRQMTDAELMQEINTLRVRMPLILEYKGRIEALLTPEQKFRLTSSRRAPAPSSP